MVLSLSGLSVALAIQSLNLYHRNPLRHIPPWQATLTRIGLRIMHLKCAQERSRSITPVRDDSLDKRSRLSRLNGKATTYGKDSRISSSNVQADVTSVVSEGDHDEMSWQLVAQAFDAFFLRLYLAIILCSSIGFTTAIASNQF